MKARSGKSYADVCDKASCRIVVEFSEFEAVPPISQSLDPFVGEFGCWFSGVLAGFAMGRVSVRLPNSDCLRILRIRSRTADSPVARFVCGRIRMLVFRGFAMGRVSVRQSEFGEFGNNPNSATLPFGPQRTRAQLPVKIGGLVRINGTDF
jgi:hypothetical protein